MVRVHNAGFIYYEHHSPQGNKYNTVRSSFRNNGNRENHQNTDEDIK